MRNLTERRTFVKPAALSIEVAFLVICKKENQQTDVRENQRTYQLWRERKAQNSSFIARNRAFSRILSSIFPSLNLA